MEDSDHKGMPIYLDNVDRKVADLVEDINIKADAWHPSNSAAHKLWRCLECMRDLDEILADLKNLKNATKKKRRLKIAITPLYSLIKAIDDLCNDIQCNPDTRKSLAEKQVREVSEIKNEFANLLPHDHKAPISTVRNKLSSHIDKKLRPFEAQKLSNKIQPSEFGRWLHICIHLVLDLTKLDIYSWSCDSPAEGYIRLMNNEPFIATFKTEDGHIGELTGLHIAKSSPRNSIPEIIDSLLKHSEWMFKKGQACISGLREDTRENWNTFLSNLHVHKASNNGINSDS